MSNAIRKIERQALRKKSTSAEAFRTAWNEFREKKWGDNIPRDTSKKKRYFADNPRILCAEMKNVGMFKQTLADKIKEKISGGKKDGNTDTDN